MTLTSEQSSNKEWIENKSTQGIISMIRIAMSEGCIKPALVYDLVDEALCRLAEHEGVSPT